MNDTYTTDEGKQMTVPIGVLPDITPASAEALDLIALDTARTEYRVTVLAHRIEAADYITTDVTQGRAHLAEAYRLTASLNAVLDELSIRATVLKSLAAITPKGTPHE